MQEGIEVEETKQKKRICGPFFHLQTNIIYIYICTSKDTYTKLNKQNALSTSLGNDKKKRFRSTRCQNAVDKPQSWSIFKHKTYPSITEFKLLVSVTLAFPR